MGARATVYTISPSPDSTLAIETRTAGLVKHKQLFVFQRFRGTLIYDSAQPLDSVLHLHFESRSLTCRHDHRPPSNHARHVEAALRNALGSASDPELRLESTRLIQKPLRGFILEGLLRFRGAERPIRANLGFGAEKNDRLQIDADASVRLSDFGIARLSSLFGFIQTEDEVILHAYLWGAKLNGSTPAPQRP